MKLKKLLPIMLVILLTLIGCTPSSTKPTNDNDVSLTHPKSLIKYQNTYIGNATSVSQIVSILPGNEFSAGLSLQTSTKPYGLNVIYDNNTKNESYQKFWKDNDPAILLEKNAVVIFSLIKNADYVEFHLNDKSTTLKFTRKELTEKYKKTLTTLFETNEDIYKFLDKK